MNRSIREPDASIVSLDMFCVCTPMTGCQDHYYIRSMVMIRAYIYMPPGHFSSAGLHPYSLSCTAVISENPLQAMLKELSVAQLG